MIMGGLYPITVVAGIHHMYNVIEAGMLSEAGGLNTWMPIASAANFAQCAACLAVSFAIAFVLTWFLWKEDEEDAKKAVKTGQRLMTFSIDKIKQSGYSTTTAVLLNNSDDYENFKVVKTGAAKKSEPEITI